MTDTMKSFDELAAMDQLDGATRTELRNAAFASGAMGADGQISEAHYQAELTQLRGAPAASAAPAQSAPPTAPPTTAGSVQPAPVLASPPQAASTPIIQQLNALQDAFLVTPDRMPTREELERVRDLSWGHPDAKKAYPKTYKPAVEAQRKKATAFLHGKFPAQEYWIPEIAARKRREAAAKERLDRDMELAARLGPAFQLVFGDWKGMMRGRLFMLADQLERQSDPIPRSSLDPEQVILELVCWLNEK